MCSTLFELKHDQLIGAVLHRSGRLDLESDTETQPNRLEELKDGICSAILNWCASGLFIHGRWLWVTLAEYP